MPVAVVMSVVTAMLVSMRLCYDRAHACGRDCDLDYVVVIVVVV
jgi:hypothetical protein